MYFHKRRCSGRHPFCRDTGHAALKTCEDEIKETNTFLSEQGVAPINDVTDLATTLRNIKNFGRLPDRYITDEANVLAGLAKKTETLGG
jgi:hypothetical protein